MKRLMHSQMKGIIAVHHTFRLAGGTAGAGKKQHILGRITMDFGSQNKIKHKEQIRINTIGIIAYFQCCVLRQQRQSTQTVLDRYNCPPRCLWQDSPAARRSAVSDIHMPSCVAAGR